MADTSFDINNGANQIAPNAMTQNQYFYGEEFARKILGSKDKPLSLIVLGAGVDATIGLPTSADLIPRIVDFLETDEGKTLDTILRKAIGRVHFHFDKFVSTAIDRLAKDLDREIVSICHNILYCFFRLPCPPLRRGGPYPIPKPKIPTIGIRDVTALSAIFSKITPSLFTLKEGSTSHPGPLSSGAREETALLGARNRYALRLAGHQSPRQVVRDGTA